MEEKSCGCIIIENDNVLLVQHKKAKHWGFPKGHMEANETEMQTAIREVKEETNLDVEIISDKKYVEHYIINGNKPKEVVYFIARKVGGSIKPQEEEVSGIGWFNFKETLDKITHTECRNVWKEVWQDLEK